MSNYKALLQQKDQELAEKSEQFDQQLNAMLEEKKQLTAKLQEAQKQLALKHEELAKEHLIMKDQQLIGRQERLQSQSLVDTGEQDMEQSIGNKLIPRFPSNSNLHLKESVSKNKAIQPAKLYHSSGSISSDNGLPQSEQLCVTNNIHSTMPADIDVMLGITSCMPYSDNVFLDSDRNGDDKVRHNEDLTKFDDEEDKVGRRIRYERDFLLSLQFLEQCKKRPPNLMNAEYIRKVSIM